MRPAATLDTNAPVETRRSEFVLLALLLVAAALRLYRLNAGLWLDEMLTYVNYANMPFGQIVTTFDSENQHFLYSILAHAAFITFGPSPWAVRLPAVLFGVGSIWALYRFGREIAGAGEGLLAAALLTFSYHHVWFSQNARGYTGLLFWTLLSSWFLARGLRTSRLVWWLLYAFAAALGMYTHLTMAFVIFGQGLAALWTVARRRGSGWGAMVAGFGAAGTLSALLFLPVITQMRQTIGGSEASVVAAWKSPLWTAWEILQGLQISFSVSVIALAALVVFGAGMWSFWRKEPLVVILMLVPPLVGAGVTVAIGHHLWPRFFFFAFGFAALVVIRGAFALGNLLAARLRLARPGAIWPGTVLCLTLLIVSAVSVPFAYGPKQDYDGALRFVQEQRQPGDAVVTVSLTSFPYLSYYRLDWAEVTSLQSLNEIRSRSERTWLLYTFPPVLESVYPEIMRSIQQEFELVNQFAGTVRGGTIFVTRADQQPVVVDRFPTQ